MKEIQIKDGWPVLSNVQAIRSYCHFCGSPIRFQIGRAGEVVNCPDCGMETVLFIPGLGTPYLQQEYALTCSEVLWEVSPLGLRKLRGVVENHAPKDLDWVRIEFILYNGLALPVGSTSDCQINFRSGKRWAFHAPVCQKDAVRASEPMLSCEYGRIVRPGPPIAVLNPRLQIPVRR